MYSRVATAAVCGIESVIVHAEADVSDGMPVFEMVGELSSEVKEARERMKAAIRNTGIRLSPKRVTVNLHPADIRKNGTGFDLPIALAVLSAYGMILQEKLAGIAFAGEISLNGEIHGIQGILPIVLAAKEAGYSMVCVPKENLREASIVKKITILPAENLRQVMDMLSGIPESLNRITNINIEETPQIKEDTQDDFARLQGQQILRRVCEIAAAGRHNLLLMGPPGAGKTMAARAASTILPQLSEQEALELAKIYSVTGQFGQRTGRFYQRPFRSPHHTISLPGLAGGGRIPKPGELSLAHQGVLFLDELTEFRKEALELLRQPLEEQVIRLVRQNGTYTYPADVMLIAAMNPCSCGYYPDRNRCSCSQATIRRHLNKISRPFQDRMDLCIEVQRVKLADLTKAQPKESSAAIRSRVEAVQKIQKKRFLGTGIGYNSRIPSGMLKACCPMEREAGKMLEEAFERLELTARGYYKIWKVAQTIADLEGSKVIKGCHVAESLRYRNMDGRMWGSL